jgi:holo-[acyl-carrier protein] synthase
MRSLRLGCDLCQIDMIGQMLKENAPILERLFNGEELAYATARTRPEEHLAGVFAAKEALAKALRNPGLLGKYHKEVTVSHREDGAVYLRLSDVLAVTLARIGANIVDVSISHDGEYAMAVVLIEMTDDKGTQGRCGKCLLTLDYLSGQKITDVLIRVEDRNGTLQYLCPVCLRGW